MTLFDFILTLFDLILTLFDLIQVPIKPKKGPGRRHLSVCLWIAACEVGLQNSQQTHLLFNLNASRSPPGRDKLLAEQHYCILFCMSLLGVVGMVGIVDLISFVSLVCFFQKYSENQIVRAIVDTKVARHFGNTRDNFGKKSRT